MSFDENIRSSILRGRDHHAHYYGLGGRVDGQDTAKYSQSDVCSLLPPCMCTCLIMKHCRINVTKRHATSNVSVSRGEPFSPAALHLPGEASHECDELIEILRASPAEYCAAYDNNEPEHVLLPLDIPV
jgi:hypothetical protein